jgi:Zn-dependent protease with chaperone function
MIPSSPRRTLLFILLSSLAYFGPDLLVPTVWAHGSTYVVLSAFYQSALVVAGFWLGPAICRTLVVREIGQGSLLATTEKERSDLIDKRLTVPPVVLFDHPAPFVLTAGLLPERCEVFLSVGLANRLSPAGVKFLLARAAVHASVRHRLGALLPVLFFTVLLPDDPKSVSTWLAACGFLIIWLMVHWAFELDVDRCAARVMGGGAADALRDVLAVTNPRADWLTTQPPLAWRLRAVQR